jgi:hypothetical protein
MERVSERGWARRIQGAALLGMIALCGAATTQPAALRIDQDKTELRVTIGGSAFTTYRFAPTPDDPHWNRPYFYPVLAADGAEVTSDQQREVLKDPKVDHPHQRSLWVGHGNVNGADHWLDKKFQQRHLKFTSILPDGFVEELAWDGVGAEPVLTETRTVKFVAYPDGNRGIDITSALTAAGGDATFKCKPLNVSGVEAGLCAVRMAKPLLDAPAATKKITTGAGAAGEKEARSTPSDWCDYSGTIAGKSYGVAMVNSPENPGGDTAWHVRLFGLLAHIGPPEWTLGKGKTATFRHLVIIHTGDAAQAGVAEKAAGWRATP